MTVLVIGGSFQGKLGYAIDQYGLLESEILDAGCAEAEWNQEKKCINRLHLLVKRLLQEGKTLDQIRGTVLPLLMDKIVICDDISCGIIPLDPFEREWRETVGRVLTALAASADQVVRIQCGLSQIIKGK